MDSPPPMRQLQTQASAQAGAPRLPPAMDGAGRIRA